MLFFSSRSFAQQAGVHSYADSLEKVLAGPLNDTVRARTLFLLSQYWADLDSAKGMFYITEALKYNPEDDFHNGMAHYYLGGALMEYDIPRSQKEYRQAVQLLQNVPGQQGYGLLAKAWHNLGILEERNGNERAFADILLNKAIPLAVKADDTDHVGLCYLSLGVVFSNIFDYDRSTEYYKKAIAIFRRKGPTNEKLVDCYSNIAENYLSKERYSEAKPFLDSAAVLAPLYPNSIYLPSFYLAQGRYYNGIQDWEQALRSFDRGTVIAMSLKRFYDATTIMMEQYQTYKAQKKYTAARELLLKIYGRPYVAEMPENMRLVLYELAKTDSALNNPREAYKWLLKFTELTDSISSNETNVRISELEAKYNYAEKEKEVLRLNERTKMQKLLLGGSLVLLLITILMSVYFYKQRRVKAEQQLQSLQQAQQIAVAQALLQGEERERRRLASDLHDGLGGMLASAKIHLSEMEQDENGRLNKVIGQLDSSVTELRRIARNMMPEALLRSGLEMALKDLRQSVATERMSVEMQLIDIAPDLPVQVQLIIYRIIQELLANVIKHAAATEVFIQCSQLKNIFYIAVEDNGRGFDVRSAPGDKKGIGLENIRHRVEFLQGKMDISSSPGKGTVINIELLCRNS